MVNNEPLLWQPGQTESAPELVEPKPTGPGLFMAMVLDHPATPEL